MTRKDQQLKKAKATRQANVDKAARAQLRVLNRFIKTLDKVAADVPATARHDSIVNTLSVIRVAVVADCRAIRQGVKS